MPKIILFALLLLVHKRVIIVCKISAISKKYLSKLNSIKNKRKNKHPQINAILLVTLLIEDDKNMVINMYDISDISM